MIIITLARVQVFKNMLLPIFDCVQVEDIDFCTFDRTRDEDADMWLYNTCSHCLQHMIDLTVKFYPLVRDQLPAVLHKIKAFMTRTHQSLASVGVAAMERLITSAGAHRVLARTRMVTPLVYREIVQGLLPVPSDWSCMHAPEPCVYRRRCHGTAHHLCWCATCPGFLPCFQSLRIVKACDSLTTVCRHTLHQSEICARRRFVFPVEICTICTLLALGVLHQT